MRMPRLLVRVISAPCQKPISALSRVEPEQSLRDNLAMQELPILEYVPQPISPARSRSFGIVLLISAAILWSLSGVVVKLVGVHPIRFTFFRSLSAAIVMGIVCI